MMPRTPKVSHDPQHYPIQCEAPQPRGHTWAFLPEPEYKLGRFCVLRIIPRAFPHHFFRTSLTTQRIQPAITTLTKTVEQPSLITRAVRPSHSCPFSFLFPCTCPWVRWLCFHIAMFSCYITTGNNNQNGNGYTPVFLCNQIALQ